MSINKQGHKITWTVAEKGPTKMQKPADAIRNNDDATDEDEPESQDSYGQLDSDWLKSGTPTPLGGRTDTTKKTESTSQTRVERNTTKLCKLCRVR